MESQDPLNGVEVLGVAPIRDLTSNVLDHLCELTDDELEEETVELGRQIDALLARFTLSVAEVERRQIPHRSHHLSAHNWLARFCSLTHNEAAATVRTARALPHMPEVTERALSGRVPYRSVRFLAQAHHRHPDEFSEQESVFAGLATYLSPGDMWRTINQWEQQIDYDQSLEDVRALDRLRSVNLSPIGNGLFDLRGTLTTEAGHIVRSAIEALTNPANLDPEDSRSPAQKRHDALSEACRFFMTHNETISTSGGEKPHITVTVPYSVLAGSQSELPDIDGAPLDPETLRRWACDAGIVRIITDADSNPLDVGRRTRTIPTAIRRAVEFRDKGCVWPGCNAPIAWCDVHHKVHWADGGPTSVDNSELLCSVHHTATHDGVPRPDE